MQTVERRPHHENARDAEQLGRDAGAEQYVDGEVGCAHQFQRPRKRAKTRPPIQKATEAITATVKRIDSPSPTDRQRSASVATAPVASSTTSPSIGRRTEAARRSGASAAISTVAAIRNAFTRAPRT